MYVLLADKQTFREKGRGQCEKEMCRYGKSSGRSGNYSTNYQISGRELMTPDEVRGERPVMDFKYDILKHPNVKLTADGGQPPYIHGEPTQAVAKLGGETADYVKKTNSSTIVDSVTVDGNVYGVPFTTNTWFMYYDKSKFSESDVKSLDTMLSKNKVAFNITEGWYMSTFYLANGCSYFGKDGKDNSAGIDISGDKGTQATQAMVSFVNNPNFVNDLQGVGIAGLRDGSVGAYFSGSWDYKSVKEILGNNFGAVSLPTLKIGGTDKQLKSFAGSKAIAVNPNCKYQQVAVALAKYLGGKDAQQSHYELRGVIPCNTELLATDAIKKDALVTAQNDTFNKTSVIQPTVSGMNDYWTPAQNFAKAVVNGEVTLDNAAAKTQDFYKQINTSIVSK